MLDASEITDEYLEIVKRHLKVTWSDAMTDTEIWEKMCRAEYVLNTKIGAEIDYFSAPTWAQSVFLNYVLYMWNNCESDFDAAYYNDLQQLRTLCALESVDDSDDEENSDDEE